MTRPTEGKLMPDRINFGQHQSMSMSELTFRYEQDREKPRANPYGYRKVLHFFLPEWQRGFVWTEDQSISFIESAWKGMNLGTYTINSDISFTGPLHNLVIDGQQRLKAVQDYLDDKFPVFGYRYSEITEIDERSFDNRTFARFKTETRDEDYLRMYYNLTNFAGTAHNEGEQA